MTEEQLAYLEKVLRQSLGDIKLVRIKKQEGQNAIAFIEVNKLE